MTMDFLQFCGSPFWELPEEEKNINLTSNGTSSPGLVFTECFQNTVLVWTPCAYLALVAPFYFWHLIKHKNNVIRLNWINLTKLSAGIALMLLCAVTMFQRVHTHHKGGALYTAVLLAPALNFIAMAVATILIEFGRKKGVRVTGVLFIFWLIQTMAGSLTLYSVVQIYRMEGIGIYDIVHASLFLVLVFIEWIFSCLVDYLPYSTLFVQQQQELPDSPERSASFLSVITFWWFTGLIILGYKRPLVKSDLWSLNTEDTAKYVSPMFEKYWKKEVEKMKRSKERVSALPDSNIPLKSAHGDNEPDVQIKSGKKIYRPSLILALTKAFGLTFFFGSFLKLVYDILIFVSPMLLRELIGFTGNKTEPAWKGFSYSFLLFAVALVQSMILHQYFHRCFLTGMRLRTSLIAAVYRKSLRLSNAARRVSTVGEIVNLMSVDAQRFTELTTYLNLVWSGPFQICVSLYFLWQTLGPSVLAGVAFMVILIPINAFIAKKNRALQAKQMVYKDSRIKLMSEILNGIKVLKLYAWEPSFEKKILDIRKNELRVMRRAAFLNAASSFTWSCAPFVVSLVTFAAYVLSSPEHVLDAEKAFVSLSLFNILRFPLAMFPTMIANIVQVSVSVKRLRAFLLNEELDPEGIQRVKSGKYGLSIQNGTFTWNTSEDRPTLQDINVAVPEGQLVAVVGVVGSGKSSLLSALLGEMNKLQGVVTIKGSIAYTAQQAWIQNATLRDNILFGKPFDEKTYKDVLEACALTSDLDVLPGGDMTEIGEKGINLSGGQKQRVSLGRAVYQDADVYLMDDPLSAVDSHVGKHIFEKVVGPKGMLAGKTRILVTHGISFLPQMDNILVIVDGRISEHGTYKELLEKGGAFAEFLKTYFAEHEESEDEEEEDIALREEILSQLSSSPKGPSVLSGSKERLPQTRHNTSRSVSSTTTSPDVRHRKTTVQSSFNESGSNKPSHQGSDKISKEDKPPADGKPPTEGQKLIKEEKSATGHVKLSLFFLYLRSMKIPVCVSIFILYTLYNVADMAANFWLSAWSNDKPINGTMDIPRRNLRLGVFGALGLIEGLLEMLSAFCLALAGLIASRVIHSNLVTNILRCPLMFFETTPTGRIINRFSQDLVEIDLVLPFTIRSLIGLFYAILSKLIVILYATPYFVVTLPLVVIIYILIQRFYVAVSRQLKRLESVSRSPIYSHFGETIQGTTTIRAFERQKHFIDCSDNAVDRNQECYYPSIVSNRWLAIRLELVGNLIVLFASLFAVIGRDHLSAGIVGLSITYAMGVTQTLNWAVRMTSELETNVVSVERVKEYTVTPTEAAWQIPEKRPPDDWPQNGEIKFKDYSTRYRDGLDLVLKGICCHIHPTEKVGLVGRTGAGKSSLTLGLFRIIEAVSGEISIDGVKIADIGLHDVRSKITIIPQDPILFSGTLRMNLDPFDHHTDNEIWTALEHAHLKTFVSSLPEQLEHVCAEGGENLSLGQRQLVCLARALLRKTKVLVLDEATAAVDLETDDLIQQTVRTEFKDCTVLTIAHRINTIMDYDRVMVLQGGKIAEIDSPQKLLADKSSLFYGLAKDAGLTDE